MVEVPAVVELRLLPRQQPVVLVAVAQPVPRDPVQLPEQIRTIRISTTLQMRVRTLQVQLTVKGHPVVVEVLAVQQLRRTVAHPSLASVLR
jgi:hypothetical protein